ncbi:hypothetical protein AB1Y20_019712 [Prymnesium parvum]|uniref:Uncharacterized protein n=1 Tax=Prymnesium parvum TaxID=97485 RepID=A0AB34JV76_PRYPA
MKGEAEASGADASDGHAGAGAAHERAAGASHAGNERSGGDEEKRRGGSAKESAGSVKYEAVLDWRHYHHPRLQQLQLQRISSVSVGEMYWRVVAPIREQELKLSRNVALLNKEHCPFTHLRRATAVSSKEKKVAKEPAPQPREGEEGKEGKEKPPVERVIYTDPSGEEFEVTADRMRKLQDIGAALRGLSLCPLLVHIWKRDGTPIATPLPSECTCEHFRTVASTPRPPVPALCEAPRKLTKSAAGAYDTVHLKLANALPPRRTMSGEMNAAKAEAEAAGAAEAEAAAAAAEAKAVKAEAAEAVRAEAARAEAARQEAARQEAARQEAARQEAARQEAARQEAARQEAAETARAEAAEAARAEAAEVTMAEAAEAAREEAAVSAEAVKAEVAEVTMAEAAEAAREEAAEVTKAEVAVSAEAATEEAALAEGAAAASAEATAAEGAAAEGARSGGSPAAAPPAAAAEAFLAPPLPALDVPHVGVDGAPLRLSRLAAFARALGGAPSEPGERHNCSCAKNLPDESAALVELSRSLLSLPLSPLEARLLHRALATCEAAADGGGGASEAAEAWAARAHALLHATLALCVAMAPAAPPAERRPAARADGRPAEEAAGGDRSKSRGKLVAEPLEVQAVRCALGVLSVALAGRRWAARLAAEREALEWHAHAERGAKALEGCALLGRLLARLNFAAARTIDALGRLGGAARHALGAARSRAALPPPAAGRGAAEALLALCEAAAAACDAAAARAAEERRATLAAHGACVEAAARALREGSARLAEQQALVGARLERMGRERAALLAREGGASHATLGALSLHERKQLHLLASGAGLAREMRVDALRLEAIAPLLRANQLPLARNEPPADAPADEAALGGSGPVLEQLLALARHADETAARLTRELHALDGKKDALPKPRPPPKRAAPAPADANKRPRVAKPAEPRKPRAPHPDAAPPAAAAATPQHPPAAPQHSAAAPRPQRPPPAAPQHSAAAPRPQHPPAAAPPQHAPAAPPHPAPTHLATAPPPHPAPAPPHHPAAQPSQHPAAASSHPVASPHPAPAPPQQGSTPLQHPAATTPQHPAAPPHQAAAPHPDAAAAPAHPAAPPSHPTAAPPHQLAATHPPHSVNYVRQQHTLAHDPPLHHSAPPPHPAAPPQPQSAAPLHHAASALAPLAAPPFAFGAHMVPAAAPQLEDLTPEQQALQLQMLVNSPAAHAPPVGGFALAPAASHLICKVPPAIGVAPQMLLAAPLPLQAGLMAPQPLSVGGLLGEGAPRLHSAPPGEETEAAQGKAPV